MAYPATAAPDAVRLARVFSSALIAALAIGAAPALAQARPAAAHSRMDEAAREMGNDARMQQLPHQKRMEMTEFVAGNMLFVLLHETGHALVTEMGLPVLGREEDAADSFAVVTMLKLGTDFSHNVLVQAAKGWFLSAERDQKQGNMLAFYDEHGLDKQRAYEIVCLMVGSDPEKFGDLANWVKMPKVRQESCQGDYSNASWSWEQALKSHRRAPADPKNQITVVYGDGKGKYDVFARSFRAIGFLDAVAGYAADEFSWRAPFVIEIQTCGDPGARWDVSTHKLTLCYELAAEFVGLIQNEGESRKPSAMSGNVLIARNIKRLRAEHSMSMEKLATDAGLNMAWVSRMERGLENASVTQLEKLAQALNTTTVEFFAAPTRGDPATPSPGVRRARK